MPRQFALPDLGEGLTEAEIVAVLVREGDVVKEDAPLLEVETDKAQVEIPSPIGGRVEQIHVQPGQTVKVGAILVTFAEDGAPARVAGSVPTRPAAAAGAVRGPGAPPGRWRDAQRGASPASGRGP
jgi:pyruvate dehydrogenase E2 component (dihydrolipoamide acetyltransferase)